MSDRMSAFAREIPFAAKKKTSSAEEKKLTRELEHLLGRPPRRHGKRARTWDQFEDDEILTSQSEEETNPESSRQTPPPLPSNANGDQAIGEDPIRSPPQLHDRTNANVWHPKPKYTRLKQAGSWLVSLLVGGFIVTTVAIILLGVPKDLDPRSWLSARASLDQQPQMSAPVPQPAIDPAHK